jgi:hypothetical protein
VNPEAAVPTPDLMPIDFDDEAFADYAAEFLSTKSPTTRASNPVDTGTTGPSPAGIPRYPRTNPGNWPGLAAD